MATNPIYEILTPSGSLSGCGTRVEFDHWTREGVFGEGWTLGAVLGEEDAEADAMRLRTWGIDPTGENIDAGLLA